MGVPTNFKITRRALVMESTFSKATENISVFCNFVEKSIMGIGIFRKVALLKISGNFLLIRAVDTLQVAVLLKTFPNQIT